MPRPKMFSNPLVKELPRVRISEPMYAVVASVAGRYEISVSDLVRACIAHTLGLKLKHENSDLIARMMKGTARKVCANGDLLIGG